MTGGRPDASGDHDGITHHVGGDDRAVSEIIAFVLVFAIVIGSVGLLSTVGFQAMEGYQEGEQLRNAERAMDALGATFDDVLRTDGVEERSGELALQGETVFVADGGTDVSVTVNDSSGTVLNRTDVALGEIAYEAGSTTIAYQGGGLFRKQRAGDALLSRPQLSCSNGAAVVSLLVVDGPTPSIESDGSIEVRAVQQHSTAFVTDDADNVTVAVDTPTYETGWDTALERGGFEGAGPYWCDDVDRAVVRTVVVEVELSSGA